MMEAEGGGRGLGSLGGVTAGKARGRLARRVPCPGHSSKVAVGILVPREAMIWGHVEGLCFRVRRCGGPHSCSVTLAASPCGPGCSSLPRFPPPERLARI